MTAEKNPQACNLGAEAQTGGSGTISVSGAGTNPEKPAALIGSTVEKALDATLWRLKSGDVRLEELTPALAAFYTIGHADGIAQMVPRLQQAESDRDRYYRAAFDPRQPIKIGPSFADLEKIRHEIHTGGTV